VVRSETSCACFRLGDDEARRVGRALSNVEQQHDGSPDFFLIETYRKVKRMTRGTRMLREQTNAIVVLTFGDDFGASADSCVAYKCVNIRL